jgi:hypothetical protein
LIANKSVDAGREKETQESSRNNDIQQTVNCSGNLDLFLSCVASLVVHYFMVIGKPKEVITNF